MSHHDSTKAILLDCVRYLTGAPEGTHTPDAEAFDFNCEVVPVGRPAKVEPIRGEYIPQAAPTARGCEFCVNPVECESLGHNACLLSSVSFANAFTDSEERT